MLTLSGYSVEQQYFCIIYWALRQYDCPFSRRRRKFACVYVASIAPLECVCVVVFIISIDHAKQLTN